MLTTRNETLRYLPQGPPFIAVHEIADASEEFARTRFEILAESLFVTEGKVSEAGLIENIAQTAAAQMGYWCSKNGIPVPLGYIASIKKFSVSQFPVVGDVLETTIQITNRIMDVVIFDAVTRCNGVVACSCEMRVFVKPANDQ